MHLSRLNPFRFVGKPMLLSAVLGLVCIVGGHLAWPLDFLPGLTLCVIGTRIAYDHRGAAGYVLLRRLAPTLDSGIAVEVHRQIEGAMVCLLGLFFVFVAVTGALDLA